MTRDEAVWKESLISNLTISNFQAAKKSTTACLCEMNDP